MSDESTYAGLNYKTRGNASPQGKPRVCFCCHEADFDACCGNRSGCIYKRPV